MTQLGGRQWAHLWTTVSSALNSAIPTEEHLAVEAVVAYVDGELSIAAHERATRHLAACSLCTAEVAAQRQARAAVRGAAAPSMPASLLAALHAIPHSVDLPAGPDGLAIGEDGEFVVAQRPLGSALFRGTPALGRPGRVASVPHPGSSTPLGLSAPLGSPASSARVTRRVVQGAGVVVSGLVLGALALSMPGSAPGEPTVPGGPAAETGGIPASGVPARFEFDQREQERHEAGAPLTAAGLPQR